MDNLSMKTLVLALAMSSGLFGQAKEVPQAEALASATSKPAPPYPSVARQFRVEGTVEVKVTIGEGGTVEKAEPVAGNPILTRSAIEAVKSWKFRSFGRPVQTILSFNFRL